MKAAVLFNPSELPQCIDLPSPVIKGDHEVLVRMTAVALKHFDKARAKGQHYSSSDTTHQPRIIGGDGACILPDGTRAYAIGIGGTMAEEAIVYRSRLVKIPAGLSDATAAALANAIIGSAMALRFRALIMPGETLLINGATGFTGRTAVQVAKHYGAGNIIATGRNPTPLKELTALGADEVINLNDDQHTIKATLHAVNADSHIDIVLDYLWGESASMILSSLAGDGTFHKPLRYVSVGSMSGDQLPLSAAILRGSNLHLTGSGLGSWSPQEIEQLFSEVLPEMFQLAADGALTANVIEVDLEDIGNLWQQDVPGGHRLVVSMKPSDE